MAERIKQGFRRSDGAVCEIWRTRVTCSGVNGCLAVYEVGFSDLNRDLVSGRENPQHGCPMVVFKCPGCGAITQLPELSPLLEVREDGLEYLKR